MDELLKDKYTRTEQINLNYLSLIKINHDLHNINSINAPLIQILQNPYTINLLEINHNLWINNNDFSDNGHNDNDFILESQILSICEEILCIINQEIIDTNELDDNFQKYLSSASEGVQIIINNMFDN